ncbi:T9SS type A sorting domain-containing protein [Nafulsella turpanensis]|uniref:T9SS type A sorting domain-containing protein n=1 Tax=Nafulsella turpanensis TaxID=1265690 RepID=UPI00034560B4|nr:T9SS type A sorting domain-containing protein [Nafulsella turpanensis]
MKKHLRTFTSSFSGRNRQPLNRSGHPFQRLLPKGAGLFLLLFTLLNTGALASHFKGGYFTYTYLGKGTYEVLMTGYWHKSEVGSIVPRYQGYPALDDSPVTVSKTLLKDGETVEHVQKQVVTWSKPGLYTISWRSCCRGEGANFNGGMMGLYGLINYKPEAPSSSPRFNNERALSFNSRQRINYVMELEDPDGHEQEFTLETPFGLKGAPYQEMLASGFQLKKDGTIVWTHPREGNWLVNLRVREKINGLYTGAYIDREVIIEVSSPGNKPDKNSRNSTLAPASLLAAATEVETGVSLYPNPVQNASLLKVALEEADWVKIDILNVSGQLVKELYAGKLEAKQSLELKIDAKELGTDKLYIGRITSSKGIKTFKLLIQ